MSQDSTTSDTPPPGRLYIPQVRRAFGPEGDQPARPATLLDTNGANVRVRYLDGTEETIQVLDPGRLEQLLDGDDLCRLDGRPLVLVSTRYRVLAVATGPATPPPQLKVSLVFVFENESVTEILPAEDDQPSLQTFAITRDRNADAAVPEGS